MICKVLCVLLLLFAFCEGEDADSVDLHEDIASAKTKLKNMTENSVKTIMEVRDNLQENSKYFNSSLPTYMAEANAAAAQHKSMLTKETNKFIGDAIDKNKPVNTFKCILRVNVDAQKMLDENLLNTDICIYDVHNRTYSEMNDLQIQLGFIQNATTGLYDTIYDKLNNCTSSSEVQQLVHQAEVRENNLRKLIRVYRERGSDLRIQFNDGQMACIRNSKSTAENVIRISVNKMKGC